MSVYRIGMESVPRTRRRGPVASDEPAAGDLADIFSRLTKWIPSEALVIYLTGVTMLGEKGSPSITFLLAMVVATPLFMLGLVFSTGRPIGREVLVAAALAGIAFAIWSMSVPQSGWLAVSGIGESAGAWALGAAILGVLFSYFAEGVMKRLS